jgi:hypothetical protein
VIARDAKVTADKAVGPLIRDMSEDRMFAFLLNNATYDRVRVMMYPLQQAIDVDECWLSPDHVLIKE